MANEAIGILFEVKGGGDINGETGKRINGQLRNLVGHINKRTDTLKLKFQIDSNHFNKQIKQLQQQLQSLSAEAKTSSAGGKSADNSHISNQTSSYKDAKRAIKEYYDVKTRLERRGSRTGDVESDYAALSKMYDDARQNAEQYFDVVNGDIVGLKKSIPGLTEDQIEMLQTFQKAREMKFDADSFDIENGAAQSWSNLTQKVHDYIDRVEYAASRDEKAADGLKELRDMANSTDYHGYDALKKKLAEVQQYINENALATETWGQKMIKTFGSRVRSALAGVVVAKLGQYLREIYINVVNLDKAMVNLQIASGKTRAEVKELTKGYAELAQQLGATTAEVAEAADTWLRQGYDTEDANTLITNSTMLAKLGQMESAEASRALTSAMKGYKVAVQDSIRVVDKFTAVDMEAAVSAGNIATAMAETAVSAETSGISMDKLIGYIATVSEVTQDGAESVGTFYKTMFARMGNVKVGRFVDDETGEDLNDVEKILDDLDIKLRNGDGSFRDFGDVLDEVGDKWDTYNNTQQNAIATAIAGTRQQEKFRVLMENYGQALEYAATSADSAGTAVEKFGDYTEGIEGKMNALKASFELLSMNVLNSDLVLNVVGFLDWVVKFLSWIIEKIGGLNSILYITLAIIATIKADSIFNFLLGFFPKLIALITTFTNNLLTMVSGFVAAKASGYTMGESISAAFNAIGVSASSAQIAVGAFTAVLGIAIIAISAIRQASQEAIQNSINSSNASIQEAEAHKENAESINELVAEYEKLASASEEAYDSGTVERIKELQNRITELVGDQAKNLDLVNGKLEDQLDILRNINKENYDAAYAEAVVAVSDAENAYRDTVSSNSFWGKEYVVDKNQDTREGFISLAQKYGVETGKKSYSGGEVYVEAPTIKFNFEDIDDFIKQYEAVEAMKTGLALDSNHGTPAYKQADKFLNDYKTVYDTYVSAAEYRDAIREAKDSIDNDENANTDNIISKSTSDAINEVQGGFKLLKAALDDITDSGTITADTLKELLKTYPELESYFKYVEGKGYVMADAFAGKSNFEILKSYAEGEIKKLYDEIDKYEEGTEARTTAQENYNNALEAWVTILRDAAIEEAVSEKEAEIERLEQEQEAYEKLVDLRKDVLKTYKEELDYHKELEKKKKNLAKLQTKLAVARLDNSLEGQAKVRELAEEVASAQEELDDFTLEHAIDVLTREIESEADEYKSVINSAVDEITKAIDGLKGSIVIKIGGGRLPDSGTKQSAYEDAQSYINDHHMLEGDKARWGQDPVFLKKLKKYIEYGGTINDLKGYHTGGLVGNIASLSSSEEFAKLLKGEFVSTPAQMDYFMRKTLPNIASYSSSGGVNVNAPLVEIKCENVTQETMPQLQKAVDKAVKTLRAEFDSVFGRTGYRKPVNKFPT